MKFELTHDIIAEKIWQRMPEADKQLRMIERSLEQRLQDYRQERGGLLGKKELNAWEAYLDRLNLDEEEKNFVEASRKAIIDEEEREKRLLKEENERLRKDRLRQRRLRITMVIIAGIIGLLAFYSFSKYKESIITYSNLRASQAENFFNNRDYKTAFLLAEKAIDDYDGNQDAVKFRDETLLYFLSKYKIEEPVYYKFSPNKQFLFTLTGKESRREYTLRDLKTGSILRDTSMNLALNFPVSEQILRFGPGNLAAFLIYADRERALYDIWDLKEKKRLRDSIEVASFDNSLEHSFRFITDDQYLIHRGNARLELWKKEKIIQKGTEKDSFRLLHEFRNAKMIEPDSKGWFRYEASGYLAVVTDEGENRPTLLEVWKMGNDNSRALLTVSLKYRLNSKDYAQDFLFSESRYLAALTTSSNNRLNMSLRVYDLHMESPKSVHQVKAQAYAYDVLEKRRQREVFFEDAFRFFKDDYLLSFTWAGVGDSVNLHCVALGDSIFTRHVIPIRQKSIYDFPPETPSVASEGLINRYLPFFQVGDKHMLAIEQGVRGNRERREVELWNLEDTIEYTFTPDTATSGAGFFINEHSFISPGQMVVFELVEHPFKKELLIQIWDFEKNSATFQLTDNFLGLPERLYSGFRSRRLVSELGKSRLLLHYGVPPILPNSGMGKLNESKRFFRIADRDSGHVVKKLRSHGIGPFLHDRYLVVINEITGTSAQILRLDSLRIDTVRELHFKEQVNRVFSIDAQNILIGNAEKELRIFDPRIQVDSLIDHFDKKWSFTEEEKGKLGLKKD
jgi:hypothetical protein